MNLDSPLLPFVVDLQQIPLYGSAWSKSQVSIDFYRIYPFQPPMRTFLQLHSLDRWFSRHGLYHPELPSVSMSFHIYIHCSM